MRKFNFEVLLVVLLALLMAAVHEVLAKANTKLRGQVVFFHEKIEVVHCGMEFRRGLVHGCSLDGHSA